MDRRIVLGLVGVVCVVAVVVFVLSDGTEQPASERPTAEVEAPPALPSSATSGTAGVQRNDPHQVAVRQAEARFAELNPTTDRAGALAAATKLMSLRCRLAPGDDRLQPYDCLRELDRAFPTPGVPTTVANAATARPGPDAEAVARSLLAASEPHVQLGILQLYSSPMPEIEGLGPHLEKMAMGLHGPLVKAAAMRLLAMSPAPDASGRELAIRLLRQAHGDAIVVACGHLSAAPWSGDRAHADQLADLVVNGKLRVRARRCLLASLTALGAGAQLKALADSPGDGSAADLAIQSAARGALETLVATP